MKTFCLDSQKDWDDGVHIILLLQGNPFTNLYVLVLLDTLQEVPFERKWLCENTVISILDYVECFMYKLTRACEIEQDNLKQNQVKMKHWYDKDAIVR